MDRVAKIIRAHANTLKLAKYEKPFLKDINLSLRLNIKVEHLNKLLGAIS